MQVCQRQLAAAEGFTQLQPGPPTNVGCYASHPCMIASATKRAGCSDPAFGREHLNGHSFSVPLTDVFGWLFGIVPTLSQCAPPRAPASQAAPDPSRTARSA